MTPTEAGTWQPSCPPTGGWLSTAQPAGQAGRSVCLQHAAVSWRSSQPSLLAFTHEVSPYTLQDRCEMCLFACRICILSGVLSCHIRTLPLNKIVFLAARCAFSRRLPRFRSQSTAYTSTHRALSCEEHLFSRDMQIFTQRVTISHQPVLYTLK